MSSIIDTLKGFTNCTCYECTSGRDMNYVGDLDAYVCEECYRELSFDNAMDEQCVEIDWNSVKNYIALHKTPKKAIKMFIDRIMEEEWQTFDVDEIYQDIITNNKFLGH